MADEIVTPTAGRAPRPHSNKPLLKSQDHCAEALDAVEARSAEMRELIFQAMGVLSCVAPLLAGDVYGGEPDHRRAILGAHEILSAAAGGLEPDMLADIFFAGAIKSAGNAVQS